MDPSTDPIYKHKPEAYFPAPPALAVAQAIRRDDVAALDRLFAQHPGLDPNALGRALPDHPPALGTAPEGHAGGRQEFGALGAQPDAVGNPWPTQSSATFAAMQA